jgi:hypothetical protein
MQKKICLGSNCNKCIAFDNPATRRSCIFLEYTLCTETISKKDAIGISSLIFAWRGFKFAGFKKIWVIAENLQNFEMQTYCLEPGRKN